MSRWAEYAEDRTQAVLFAERLDDAVPADHAVRLLDELLSSAVIDWKLWEAPYHRDLGQPAVHPRILVSVILYGVLTRIRSSRGLEDALQMRLDYRWLAHGRRLDHTTLSQFRRQHSRELRQLFVQIVQLARSLDLIHFQRLGFDGTRVRANNRRSGTRTPEQLQQERAELQAQIDAALQAAEAEDTRDEELFGRDALAELPPELRDKQARAARIAAALAELARVAAAGGTVPQRVPTTDLDARVMPNKDGGSAPNYTPLAMVDITSGLIVVAEVLAEHNEDRALLPQYKQVVQDFGVRPLEILADGLIGTGANLAACEAESISLISPCPLPDPANPALRDDPRQPVAESDWARLPVHRSKFNGQPQEQLDKSAFVYDAAQNCYWCPLGQALPHAGTTSEKNGSGRRVRDRYQADAQICAACPLRQRCVPDQPPKTTVQSNSANKDSANPTGTTDKTRPPRGRTISREQYEAQRERQAQKMSTPEAQATYALRRHPGERPFAMLKQAFGVRRFLLRGLERVRDEWRWAATAFNLQRLMSLMRSRAGPPRPPALQPA